MTERCPGKIRSGKIDVKASGIRSDWRISSLIISGGEYDRRTKNQDL